MTEIIALSRRISVGTDNELHNNHTICVLENAIAVQNFYSS